MYLNETHRGAIDSIVDQRQQRSLVGLAILLEELSIRRFQVRRVLALLGSTHTGIQSGWIHRILLILWNSDLKEKWIGKQQEVHMLLLTVLIKAYLVLVGRKNSLWDLNKKTCQNFIVKTKFESEGLSTSIHVHAQRWQEQTHCVGCKEEQETAFFRNCLSLRVRSTWYLTVSFVGSKI